MTCEHGIINGPCQACHDKKQPCPACRPWEEVVADKVKADIALEILKAMEPGYNGVIVIE